LNIPATLISALIGLPLLAIAGPLLGEMVATTPPLVFNTQLPAPSTIGLPFETVAFHTDEDLTLRGWFFPADQPEAPAIIYAPATSHDQRSGLSLVRPLNEAGYHVLLFSYRGSGASDGNRFGFTYGAQESRDVDAAVNYLYETRGIRKIGAIGHSAGAVSIILSAARNPHIAAIAAASPFPSLEAVWETSRPVFFPRPFYSLVMRLAAVRKGFSYREVRAEAEIARIAPRPVLLIHGSDDRRVTASQALSLYKKARGPKEFLLIENASHHEVRSPGLDDQASAIINFFDSAFSSFKQGKFSQTPIQAF